MQKFPIFFFFYIKNKETNPKPIFFDIFPSNFLNFSCFQVLFLSFNIFNHLEVVCDLFCVLFFPLLQIPQNIGSFRKLGPIALPLQAKLNIFLLGELKAVSIACLLRKLTFEKARTD